MRRPGRQGRKPARRAPRRGRDTQAVEELQRPWAHLRQRGEQVERGERDSERQGERAWGAEETESSLPLQLFRQPGIPPEAEQDVQELACRGIQGVAARIEERDREVADLESRMREEEALAACRGPLVIPDPERGTPSTGSGCAVTVCEAARGDSDDGRHKRGKRRRVEERGQEGTTRAPPHTSPSPEPTETDLGPESLLPRYFARNAARRGQGRVWRRGAEEVARWSAT